MSLQTYAALKTRNKVTCNQWRKKRLEIFVYTYTKIWNKMTKMIKKIFFNKDRQPGKYIQELYVRKISNGNAGKERWKALKDSEKKQ